MRGAGRGHEDGRALLQGWERPRGPPRARCLRAARPRPPPAVEAGTHRAAGGAAHRRARAVLRRRGRRGATSSEERLPLGRGRTVAPRAERRAAGLTRSVVCTRATLRRVRAACRCFCAEGGRRGETSPSRPSSVELRELLLITQAPPVLVGRGPGAARLSQSLSRAAPRRARPRGARGRLSAGIRAARRASGASAARRGRASLARRSRRPRAGSAAPAAAAGGAPRHGGGAAGAARPRARACVSNECMVRKSLCGGRGPRKIGSVG